MSAARTMLRAAEKSQAIGVLTFHEAAVRLGISTTELEAMVASGRIRTVIAGWTRFAVADDVERLRSPRS